MTRRRVRSKAGGELREAQRQRLIQWLNEIKAEEGRGRVVGALASFGALGIRREKMM